MDRIFVRTFEPDESGTAGHGRYGELHESVQSNGQSSRSHLPLRRLPFRARLQDSDRFSMLRSRMKSLVASSSPEFDGFVNEAGRGGVGFAVVEDIDNQGENSEGGICSRNCSSPWPPQEP